MVRHLLPLLGLLSLAAPAFATINGAWHPLESVPGATRMGHNLVFDGARGRSLVFGGYNSVSGPLNETLLLLAEMDWGVPSASARRPAPRLEAAMALDVAHDRMILFGGKNQFRYFGDVWQMRQIGDSIAWDSLSVVPGPTPRESRMVYDAPRHRMLVLCGWGNDSLGPNRAFNEVWALDLDVAPPAWSRVTTAGAPPEPRVAHSAVYDPIADRVLMFGGSDFAFYWNEVWSLDLTATPPTWRLLTPSGTPPSGRYGAVVDMDHARNRLVLWSGYSRFHGFLSDAWVLWLDGTPRWESIAVSSWPDVRDFAAGRWDGLRQSLVVCGGNSPATTFGDAAELRLNELPVAALASLVEVEATSDRVSLTWQLAPGIAWADLERRTAGGSWRTLARLSVGAGERVIGTDGDVTPGETYDYRLTVPRTSGNETLDEVRVSVPGALRLRFAGATPNPASGDVWVSYELSARADVSVELFDVSGRRVAGRVSHDAAGAHRVRLAAAGELRAGLYLARFRAAGVTREARVIVSR